MDLHGIAAQVVPAAGTAVVGWLGQHVLKASKSFDTNVAHAIMFGLGFGFYAIGNHQIADPTTWFLAGCAWSGSLGIATGSVLSGLGAAAVTNSRP
jgi:hypothetical protein